MLRNWLKIAFINYKKNWLSTFINLFGLTLGLAGFVMILMHWIDEESYEKWNPKKENVYYVQPYFNQAKTYGSTLSYPFAYQSFKKISDIQDFALIGGTGSDKLITHKKTFYSDKGMTVSEHFFNVFSLKLIAGNYKNIFENKQDIAISSRLSKNLFGEENPIGQSIKFGLKEYFVKAVYEHPKNNTQIDADYIFYASQIENDKKEAGNFNYACFFLIKQNADLSKIQNRMYKEVFLQRAKENAKEISLEKYLELYGPNDVLFTRIDKIKLHSKNSFFGSGDFKTILILFSLSILIIILSAINFINLKTAQASQRAKEVGVRKAIGGTRMSLFYQFLLETLIICLTSYILSLVLVELLLPKFNDFFKKEIKFNNPYVFGYSFLVSIITSLIAGVIPAFYLSNFKAIETLKGNFSRSKNGTILRNSILGLQIIISSFFIVGSLVVNQQVHYMMNKDLGFKGNQILYITINEYTPKPWLKYERLKTELKKISGVVDVSYGEASPGSGSMSSSNIDYKQTSINGRHGSMDYNYLPFIGVKLKKGRWLNPNLASDTINTLIVNEAFVRKFGWNDDQTLQREVKPGFDDKKYKIVGIIKDFNLNGLNSEVDPVVFFHYKETSWKRDNIQNLQVKIDQNDIVGTQERIKNYWESKVEQGYPFTSYFLDKNFAKTFEKYQKQQTLFSILNFIVLLVALLGLFALSSLMIEQKLKEVAIRKTLGASDSELIFGLTKKFLWITIIAVLISLPISYYFMNEWLKDFAYRIDMPVWPYLLSLVLLLILTFAVVSFKAFRATKISLVNYLKYE